MQRCRADSAQQVRLYNVFTGQFEVRKGAVALVPMVRFRAILFAFALLLKQKSQPIPIRVICRAWVAE